MSGASAADGGGQAAGPRRRSTSLENDPEKRESQPRRARPVSLVRSMSTNVDSQLAGQIFDHFCSSSTLKSILRSYRYLCEVLRLKPNQITYFYPKLKANLLSWKAQALWTKLDKRASQKCYNRGKACSGTRVLIIGAGPCGLRTAIEAQLLGAKVVVVEKRDRYSRNNVLHLWPYNIHDLRALGAKKFYGKFCAGSIDHISIRQLQCILLKVSLLLGVEVFEGVGFEELVEPVDTEAGWRARVSPKEHPVSQYEFDVLIGADGKRNTLAGFKRKEFRGKLAIAITANFINKYSEAEGQVEEISGVAFIFNQKFFKDLNQALGIDLENIVYYKDETHYFVMTAKKQSLLAKGVLIQNHPEPSALLNPANICQEALFQYAREAADFATKGQLPHLDFAVNHYGKPDVAMFDFTSMYAADHSARVIERHGHRLLQCLVGDSLLEPFWPTGTGCPRGFFSAMDAMWLMKQLESGKMSVLECLAERESIYRILSQTTPENTCKNFSSCSIDPTTRYPTLNLRLVLPFQVTQLHDTDNPAHLQPQNVLQDSAPRKKRRKESHVNPGTLLTWIQKQVELYSLEVTDMTTSFHSGLVLCAIIHRYRPDLLNYDVLEPEDLVQNNQLAFDILESELGLQPVTTGQEIAGNVLAGRPLDKLAIISYLTGVYELFRREIPHTQHEQGQGDDLEDSVYYHNHKAKPESWTEGKLKRREEAAALGQLVAEDALRRKERRSEEKLEVVEGEWGEAAKGKRVSNKKRLAKLMERAVLQERRRSDKCEKMEPMSIKNEENFKKIKEILAGERRRDNDRQRDKKPDDLRRAIGRLDSQDWNVKLIEEKLRETKSSSNKVEKVPKWSKEAFNDKLKKVKCTLEQREAFKRSNSDVDASLSRLQRRVTEGTSLDTGERGANKVSAIVGELASKLVQPAPARDRPELRREPSAVWQPPKQKSSRSSENCHFCQEKVYVVERMSAEGKFFHRACFRCDYCNILLRLGSYVYHREGRFATRFFCIPHSTENALEKYKFRKKVDELQAAKERPKKAPPSLVALNKERLADPPDLPCRGTTPERAEFEASVNSHHSDANDEVLEVMDEDEWTDLNFGNSTNCANTSDDSVSDLESDAGGEDGDTDLPLTANQTRKLAREYRASQGFRNEGLDVRYTDQEYEDSSDCDNITGTGRVHRTRRRNVNRASSSTDGDSSDDLTDTDTDSDTDEDDDAACDEEIRAIERRDTNPFHHLDIPRIVVQPNSPVPTSGGLACPPRHNKPDVVPEAKYVSQRVPLSPGGSGGSVGPTPAGTALYQPSSLAKYQYKTPDFTKAQPQGPQYRTLSGVVSNNLKKNWVAPTSGQASQTQKRVDQREIDARLRSLMDRLSNQQSLLKPAEKPSAQMQHYLDSTNKPPARPAMPASSLPYVPYRPAAPAATSPSSCHEGEDTVTASPQSLPASPAATGQASVPPATAPAMTSVAGENLPNGFSEGSIPAAAGDKTVPDVVSQAATESGGGEGLTESSGCESETTEEESTETDNDTDNSHTTGGSDRATKAEVSVAEVPEIKINLAEVEDLDDSTGLSPSSEALPPAANRTSAPAAHDEEDVDFIDDDDDATEVVKSGTVGGKTETMDGGCCAPEVKEETCSVPGEDDNVVESSTTTNTDQEQRLTVGAGGKAELQPGDIPCDAPKGGDRGPNCEEPAAGEGAPAACDSSANPSESSAAGSSSSSSSSGGGGAGGRKLPVRRPSLLKTVVSIKSDEPVTVVNYEIVDQPDPPAGSDETRGLEEPPTGGDNSSQRPEIEDSCEGSLSGQLEIVASSASPAQPGDRESTTDPQEENYQDISQVKNASERRAKLNLYQQKQSNIVHDLIMGIPRQRRTRAPRATIPTSSIPPPPVELPQTDMIPAPTGIDALGDFQMIDDEEDSQGSRVEVLRRDSGSSPMKGRGSPSCSTPLKGRGSSSLSRSPVHRLVSLPPTPITNPEKFGIRPKDPVAQLAQLASPTESISSNNTENLDGIISTDSSVANSPKKMASNQNTPVKKAGRGLMSAVTSMFRSSPSSSPAHQRHAPATNKNQGNSNNNNSSNSSSAVTSPDSNSNNNLLMTPTRGRQEKKEKGKGKTGGLVEKTAALSLTESSAGGHRRASVEAGGQQQRVPLAGEDNLSDSPEKEGEEEGEDSLVSLDLMHLANSGLPSHLLDRLEKRFSRRGQAAAGKASMARIRRVQEIQRELQVIEIECGEVEKEGVVLEKRLSGATASNQPDLQTEYMADWYRLLGEKNRLVRREQELMVESKQLELSDMADREECELARVGGPAAVAVLENLARIVEQREELQQVLDKDRERYRREDKEIQQRMEQQGIRPTS